MRRSPLRHTVAVLRTAIGLTQKELAALVGRASRTIQSIELGHLRLSEELALRIGQETGVDESWLLQGDTRVPPRKGAALLAFDYKRDRPYNREDYEWQRAYNEAQAAPQGELAAVLKKSAGPGIGYVALTLPQAKAAVLACRPGMIESMDEKLLAAMAHFFKQTLKVQDALLVRWKLRRLLETLAEEHAIALPKRDLSVDIPEANIRKTGVKKGRNGCGEKSSRSPGVRPLDEIVVGWARNGPKKQRQLLRKKSWQLEISFLS